MVLNVKEPEIDPVILKTIRNAFDSLSVHHKWLAIHEIVRDLLGDQPQHKVALCNAEGQTLAYIVPIYLEGEKTGEPISGRPTGHFEDAHDFLDAINAAVDPTDLVRRFEESGTAPPRPIQ